ncbi:hypothetical protein ES702_06275 [subsurface metagenome]
MSKARLNQMADKMHLPKAGNQEKPKNRKREIKKSAKIDPNPEKGQRSDFLKATVTLSPEIYQLLMAEIMKRQVEKATLGPGEKKEYSKAITLSGLIRETIVEYFQR